MGCFAIQTEEVTSPSSESGTGAEKVRSWPKPTGQPSIFDYVLEVFRFGAIVRGHMESDVSYFRRRASEARTAALHARQASARAAHVAMAERYEDLVRGIMVTERVSSLGVEAA
jgi:hypothetical protein